MFALSSLYLFLLIALISPIYYAFNFSRNNIYHSQIFIMSRPIERLKKQLIEIAEVVNAFQSEAVQVRVVDKLLDAMIEFERSDEGYEIVTKTLSSKNL
jgi:hypothetical protein